MARYKGCPFDCEFPKYEKKDMKRIFKMIKDVPWYKIQFDGNSLTEAEFWAKKWIKERSTFSLCERKKRILVIALKLGQWDMISRSIALNHFESLVEEHFCEFWIECKDKCKLLKGDKNVRR